MPTDPSQWLGLLNWSTKYHDGTSERPHRELSEEDKKWLEEALSAGMVDETKLMGTLLDALCAEAAGESVDESKVNDVTEQLEDIVCQIDRARDLVKAGRLADIASLLRSQHVPIRAAACRLLSSCAQNNLEVQEKCILPDLAILHSVTHLVVHDSSPAVALRALGALSCIIRSFPAAETLFIEEGDGLLVLGHTIATPHSTMLELRRRRKALHLLRHLMASSEATRHHLLTDKPDHAGSLMLRSLIDLIGGFKVGGELGNDGHDVDSAETVLQLFTVVLERDSSAKQSLNDVKLDSALSSRLESVNMMPPSMLEQAQEERGLIERLLALLSGQIAPPAQTPQTRTTIVSEQAGNTVFTFPGERQQAVPPFVATNEFQRVLPGQSIPHGLHVRLNMTTGEREAKLLDPNESDEGKTAQIVSVDRDGHTVVTPQ